MQTMIDVKFYLPVCSIDHFEVFRINVEDHYAQIDADYLSDIEFQTAYLERRINCYVGFLVKCQLLHRSRKYSVLVKVR
jgi:hypothetical protein